MDFIMHVFEETSDSVNLHSTLEEDHTSRFYSFRPYTPLEDVEILFLILNWTTSKDGTGRHRRERYGRASKLGRDGTNNGQCQNWSTTPPPPPPPLTSSLFRSKPPAPGLWTSRKAWNKLIKSEHGNIIRRKKPEKPSNIPSLM